ncbi:MAG TPA: enoyl-CoA hydratase-related protein [Sphingobacteriaceae bacterium]|nr:enoyl-CoA hydratase-related protein [Sphingobacteriaceae bacterium]
MNQGILVERGPVARITFNRPDQRNALRYEDWSTLAMEVPRLAADSTVRVIVFTGAGDKAFSAGGDISQFPQWRMGVDQAREYQKAVESALQAIMDCPQPTVARINGACTGGGLQVATACDVRLAAAGARFGMPIARIGVVIGWRELERLVELIGIGGASDLLLTGRLVDAQEAKAMGLVQRVAAPDQLDQLVEETIEALTAGSPYTHRVHKEMLALLPKHPGLQKLPAKARELPLTAVNSMDYREGVAAFLEGRRPNFTGR